MTDVRTFPDLLAARLRTSPGSPLLTAYDDRTGDRTELSVTTYANWVSKTANLLLEELSLDPGDTVLIDLPPHWLVPVFLGAAWSAGLAVTRDPQVGHRLVVCGPDSLDGGTAAEEVLACSLRPFAVRFAEPMPAGILDYGLLWPGQSDVFVPLSPVTPETVAWGALESTWSHSELLERAGHEQRATGERLLTDVHPGQDQGVPAFLGPLAHRGSVVLLLNPADPTWEARHADERATAELRSSAQPPSL